MARRLIALACIVLVVVAAVAPAISSHFSDVLQPLPISLFPVLTLVLAEYSAEPDDLQPATLLSLISPRAPPAPAVLA
jgi:hypothetical protein